jgi:osmotically-inducible protein OsmY
VTGMGTGVRGAALLVLTAAVLGLAARSLSAQSPTPGPAERAGEAVDHAVEKARDELAELALATRVRIAVLEDLKSAGLRVRVAVNGAAVELDGSVPAPADLERARGAAARVAGVRSVRSKITVAATPPPEAVAGRAVTSAERSVADVLLEARVKAHLIDQLGRVAFSITVDASSGTVRLSGEVPDEPRHALAVRLTREIPGVTSVSDALRVRP